jgi:hypothetical protein
VIPERVRTLPKIVGRRASSTPALLRTFETALPRALPAIQPMTNAIIAPATRGNISTIVVQICVKNSGICIFYSDVYRQYLSLEANALPRVGKNILGLSSSIISQKEDDEKLCQRLSS